MILWTYHILICPYSIVPKMRFQQLNAQLNCWAEIERRYFERSLFSQLSTMKTNLDCQNIKNWKRSFKRICGDKIPFQID